jgi:hypothetical protein
MVEEACEFEDIGRQVEAVSNSGAVRPGHCGERRDGADRNAREQFGAEGIFAARKLADDHFVPHKVLTCL